MTAVGTQLLCLFQPSSFFPPSMFVNGLDFFVIRSPVHNAVEKQFCIFPLPLFLVLGLRSTEFDLGSTPIYATSTLLLFSSKQLRSHHALKILNATLCGGIGFGRTSIVYTALRLVSATSKFSPSTRTTVVQLHFLVFCGSGGGGGGPPCTEDSRSCSGSRLGTSDFQIMGAILFEPPSPLMPMVD